MKDKPDESENKPPELDTKVKTFSESNTIVKLPENQTISDSNTFIQPGFWMIEPIWFQKAVADAKAGIKLQAQVQPLKGFEAVNGIAIIDIIGPMTKGFNFFGGVSTNAVRRSIRDALDDEAISSILLHIDSPGGHVAGTQQLADDIHRANMEKPVFAHIEDLGASAAFWIASQAGTISANSTAEVGSLGTIAVVEDFSGMLDKMGIKVHVISTGKFKGAFVGGTEVSKEHLADLQERIDDINELFMNSVSDGRGLVGKELKEIFDGRVHIANKAMDLGLIDEVRSMEETIQQIMAFKHNDKKDKDRHKTAEILIRLSEY